MTTTSPYTPELLEQAAREYLRNAAEIERLTDMQDQIKGMMAAAKQAGIITGKEQLGQTLVSVRPGNARLDTKKLAEAFPVIKHPELYKPALDTASVRAHIAKVDLETFEVRGADVVTIKAAE